MSFETFPQYPPVDGELVDRIVCKLKSQGIFDQFRKDCLADVDTKPAYQNLQQRVNGTVATFLATQTWQQDLNKTQLRESLRRHVQQGFLEVGVDRIVDQVVNPKVFTVFMPKVEDVVYDCLGIEKPKHPPPSNNLLSGRKLTLLDLLPKDLDPVSPDSDNLSFDDDETKDETNNNESSSKLDISHDSQVSGISDLSSHMGDSFKENHIDSNTVKSVTSVKENSTEPHFENFENLSEKIKQAEIGGHNSATSPLPEEQQDNTESKITLEVEENHQKDNTDDTLMEIDSVSNSTFEDAKIFSSKIIKEDTCSRTISEDSLSCSSFHAKFKKDKSKSVVGGISENSLDKSEVDNPCKELSSDKEIKISSVNEDIEIKTEDKNMENKEPRKTDELKDKKHRESSSKTSKSSRPSDSKHRSSSDKKDDIKHSKEKTYKEDKDKEKLNKDDKDSRTSKHKDDRHYSSKDKYKEKDKNDRNREKDGDKKKDKFDYKDSSEKDKRNEKEQDRDKCKDKDKNDKEKNRNDKENHKYEKEKNKPEKDKDRHEKEKDKYEKDRHEKSKRDKEKEKREKDKYDSKDKDKDRNEKDKDKNEKDRSREKDRGKSEKDFKNEKDKESRPIDEKIREDKKRDSKKYDRTSSSSSLKKDDSYKNEIKDKSKRSDENAKEKTSNSKSSKNEEEKRERKRKNERCNDEIKLKEARRSWDRDSSGGNGKGHGSHKSNNSEYKVNSSSASTKEKRTGESSSHQKVNERKIEPFSETEEPSDVDKILMKINSSIEESQNFQSNDEQAIKKPKIARNIFEIRKIMQARKNIARLAFKQDKKRKEMMDSAEEVNVTDSPSTTEPPPRGNPKIREENKENIKSGQMDKLKNSKVGPVKGKFNGFVESDIEQARNSLQIFRAHFSTFCASLGMNVLPSESIERVDYSKICDFSDDLLDDNLNKLKPKPVSLERRKTYPDDNQVSKAVENIMSGKNGCYVLLQDCNEVVEAMRNAGQPPLNKSTNKLTPSKSQHNSSIDGDSNKTSSGKNGKMLDRFPKKETLSSAVVKPVPQILECAVDVGTEIISHTSQQQLKQQGNSAKKNAVRASAAKQEPAQDTKDEEAFSPVADVTIALNTYLNDSKEILPSVPLTEAMLDNLMQQSSIIVEDETFADSDDSFHEYERVKQMELGEESESDGMMMIPSDDSQDDEPRSKRIPIVINSSSCDMFTHNRDSSEETSEIKVIKRRNQRLCRSASQRYDSTDLYKPRPVLSQNSKRVRTPRSVSSEDVSTRGPYESTPSRKRAR